MPNNFFQFKQFIVHQDQCAMKVCTDSCLFGAWVAAKCHHATKILDIGAGTGLLSLMLAQQAGADIDSIEIEEHCYIQLKANLSASLWSNRLKAVHGDVTVYRPDTRYDFIITNPPFFKNDLPSDTASEKLAKHSRDLSLTKLLLTSKQLLYEDGQLALLMPAHRETETEELARQFGFFVQDKVMVHQSERHPAFRIMYLFSSLPGNYKTAGKISIREGDSYSAAFTELLRPYYLAL